MKNFNQGSKKIFLIFLFFLLTSLASGIYLKMGSVGGNGREKIDRSGNQDLPQKQVQDKINFSSSSPASQKNSTPTETILRESEGKQRYIFYIEDKKYEIYLQENGTVYDLMSVLEQRGEIDFKGRVSAGLGFFVDEINGQKNSPSNNKFWIYYINGKTAEVGISNYVLKPNDVINWKYEKPQF